MRQEDVRSRRSIVVGGIAALLACAPSGTRLADTAFIEALGSDRNYVYWVANGRLERCDPSQECSDRMIIADDFDVSRIAIDDRHVYGLRRTAVASSTLIRVAKGQERQLSEDLGTPCAYGSLRIDDQAVYCVFAEAPDEVVRTDKQTLTTTRFATPERTAAHSTDPGSFEVDASSIYYFSGTELRGVDRLSGEVTVYAEALYDPRELLLFRPEIGEDRLFWIENYSSVDLRHHEYRLWTATPQVALSGTIAARTVSPEETFSSLTQHGGFWLMYLQSALSEQSTVMRVAVQDAATRAPEVVGVAPHLERLVSTGTHAVARNGLGSPSRLIAFPAFQ